MRACDYRVVEMDYDDTYTERVATCGGMDSELTGNRITEKRTWRVVAPSLEMAQEWWRTTSGHVDGWKVLEWRDLGPLQALIMVT